MTTPFPPNARIAKLRHIGAGPFRGLRIAVSLVVFALLLARSLRAVEPWTDERLPVRDGVELWFDCTRQNAGRSTLQLPPLSSWNTVDYLIDGSGQGRHLAQHRPEGRPRYRQEFYGTFLQFDGEANVLSASGLRGSLTNATIFIVAMTEPQANADPFHGILALNRNGANDYLTGLNLDLTFPPGRDAPGTINAEGNGFSGAVQLLQRGEQPAGGWRLFALECGAGPRGVKLYVNGVESGARDRQPGVMRLDEFVVGARHYSPTGDAPYHQGFFRGAISEVLVFNRVLGESERTAVEQYFNRKDGLLMNRAPELLAGAKALVYVTNPPAVQMFVPGFAVRELPVVLNNINNLKYRPDGKLVALGYDGTIHLLSDPDGTGLEKNVEPFWTNETLRAPIGMALTPPGYARGQGVFVASKGKLSLIVDTNNDDRADEEIVVAQGWKELPNHGVDALGVALDGEGNIYFGLGTANYTDAYLIDKANGRADYDLKSERGTILKVSPDFMRREIVCTGIRFPVGMALNHAGDLFCTDQEGATWLPNGNPLDELLYIQPGRHYGFPPRHPRYLTNVIDEPSVFDYRPQHQSTCGLNFNDPVNGGPVFGPAWWTGDAIVSGYSRGKLWRTKLVKTATGYVAQNQQIASLSQLTVDACVSPRGDLVVATHSGSPDWGSGPKGQGNLYQIRYTDKDAPQPVVAWSANASEIRVAFDRPIMSELPPDLARHVDITRGANAGAGDRFEKQRPGYAAVYNQLSAPRFGVAVTDARLTPDRRTLVLSAKPVESAGNYAITLPVLYSTIEEKSGAPAHIDLLTDLSGLEVHWHARSGSAAKNWDGWLPHPDLEVAQAFTRGSADHDALWPKLREAGTLVLRGQFNLWEMLHPAIQPGAKLDYERPAEEVTVVLSATVPFTVSTNGASVPVETDAAGKYRAILKHHSAEAGAWLPFETALTTGSPEPRLTVEWFTADDPRPRAFPLRRFLVPWAHPASGTVESALGQAAPEIAGGNWLRGRQLFFGETVACAKCHMIRGEGHHVGPNLSNVSQRDYASVLKDIREPSATINPDHVAYNIELADGGAITAILQGETTAQITVADVSGKSRVLTKSSIKSMKSSSVSLMPEGLLQALSAEQVRDLVTFLLVSPLEPAPLEIPGAPAPRKPTELEALLKSIATNSASTPPLQIVLCAGPKDHGTGEHDYPLWQTRWSKLLAVATGVKTAAAWEWPSAEQWRTANVVVFYSDNPGWNAAHAADLDAFLARGGGAVFVHFAVDGHDDPDGLAKRIGLAWRGGVSKFRHGALNLALEPGPFTANLPAGNFMDESYWNLVGDPKDTQLIASNIEDGEARPLIWTYEQGKGRVFVSIPGHYSWTFDDPVFRTLLLRGISWAAGQPIDRLTGLATVGARIGE